MTEIVTDAVVLRAMDFRDNDKIIFLLSPTEGKISAVLKGVKKAAAKLKYAGEPFCFAEFTLARRGGMATVAGCAQKESFFGLRQDVEAYYCGSAVMEIASVFSAEGQGDPELFGDVIRALERLSEGGDKKITLIPYILAVLENFGQKPVFGRCAECGAINPAFFDFSAGGALCAAHAGPYASSLDAAADKVIAAADEYSDRPGAYRCGDVPAKKALALLADVFSRNFKKIKSLEQLLLL